MYLMVNEFFDRAKVLIDTWWNVNASMSRNPLKVRHRFNRYMVECEFISHKVLVCVEAVLIDTWWNVNIAEPDDSFLFPSF